MITNEERSTVYRELAEALPDWEGMGMLEQWLLDLADALDGPQAVWERSLLLSEEQVSCSEYWLEDALHHLRNALAYERKGDIQTMLEHSQMAAAHVVARRRSLGDESKGVCWSVEGEVRAWLREAVRLLMTTDTVEGFRETIMLRRIEDLLRTIWERNR